MPTTNETRQPEMSMDDGPVGAVDNAPAKDVDGVPYCKKHHCRMKHKSSGSKESPTAYYACPVSGCDEKGQRIKTKNEKVVPAQPQECPRCSKGKKKVYCERYDRVSTPAMVILKCPDCNWKSNAMAVPQLAAAHFASRQSVPVAGIGDR